MIIRHKFRDAIEGMKPRRLVFEHSASNESLGENMVNGFLAQSWHEGMDVDKEKNETIALLNRFELSEDGLTKAKRAEFLVKIEVQANKLKSHQLYFADKLKLGQNLEPIEVSDAVTFKQARERRDLYEKINGSRLLAGLINEPDFFTMRERQQEKMNVYFDSLKQTFSNDIRGFSEKLSKSDKPKSGVDWKDLVDGMKMLKAKMAEYKAVSAVDRFLVGDKNIEEYYASVVNFYSAKENMRYMQGSDDEDKKEEAKHWLDSARGLHDMRQAKDMALMAMSNIKLVVDDNNTNAVKSWEEAERLSKTNYHAAMLKYAEVEGDCKMFVENAIKERNDVFKSKVGEFGSKRALLPPAQKILFEKRYNLAPGLNGELPSAAFSVSKISDISALKWEETKLSTAMGILDNIRGVSQSVGNAVLRHAAKGVSHAYNESPEIKAKAVFDFATDAGSLNVANSAGFTLEELGQLAGGSYLIYLGDGKSVKVVLNGGMNNGKLIGSYVLQNAIVPENLPKPEAEPIVTQETVISDNESS